MCSDVYTRKVDTPDDLLTRMLDVAVRIKERGDQFRPAKLDIPAQLAKYIETGVGIFFPTFVANCNKSVSLVQRIFHLNIKSKYNYQ